MRTWRVAGATAGVVRAGSTAPGSTAPGSRTPAGGAAGDARGVRERRRPDASTSTRATSPAERTARSISSGLVEVTSRSANDCGVSAACSSAIGGETATTSPSARTFSTSRNARTPGSCTPSACLTRTITPGPSMGSTSATSARSSPAPSSMARNSAVDLPPAASCSRCSAATIAFVCSAFSDAESSPDSSASAQPNSASMSSGDSCCTPRRTRSRRDSMSCAYSARAW